MQANTLHVVGAASYQIEATEFALRITLEQAGGLKSMGASHETTKETETVLTEVLDRLNAQGIPDSAIFFEGTGEHMVWRKNSNLKRRTNTLLIRLEDQAKLAAIPFELEDIPMRKVTLGFQALPPVFPEDHAKRAAAFGEALVNARCIAQAMAQEQGRVLGALIAAEDKVLFSPPRGGAYAEFDQNIVMGGSAPAIEERAFATPVKTLRVELRALFALEPLA